jgi:hypothetical protein
MMVCIGLSGHVSPNEIGSKFLKHKEKRNLKNWFDVSRPSTVGKFFLEMNHMKKVANYFWGKVKKTTCFCVT